jgi:hypothetical protein
MKRRAFIRNGIIRLAAPAIIRNSDSLMKLSVPKMISFPIDTSQNIRSDLMEEFIKYLYNKSNGFDAPSGFGTPTICSTLKPLPKFYFSLFYFWRNWSYYIIHRVAIIYYFYCLVISLLF